MVISLVTGASSGLGRDIASLLCKKGHIVYVVARRKEKLEELKKDCKNDIGEIRIIAGDLTDSKFRISLINIILKKEMKIDYLINNAGYGKLQAHEKISFKDIQGMIDLNILAGQHLIQLVLPSMKERGRGRIINIASIAAIEPPPYFATYNSTKYAMHGFTKSLNYELNGTGVSASVVFPPRMDTHFWIIAFKCKQLSSEEQRTCIKEWTKNSSGSLSVAKYIVRHLDSKAVILLPGFLPKFSYYVLRHFRFIGSFFIKNFQLRKAKKLLKNE